MSSSAAAPQPGPLTPSGSSTTPPAVEDKREALLAPRVALAALALAILLPLLNPIHLLPIQSFHQDWIAGTLLCLAAVVVSAVARGASPGIPRIALPLFALAALALLHAATGLAPRTRVSQTASP